MYIIDTSQETFLKKSGLRRRLEALACQGHGMRLKEGVQPVKQ